MIVGLLFHTVCSTKFVVGLTRGGLAHAGEDALTEGSCADLRLRAAEAAAEGSRGTLSQGHAPHVGQGTGRIDTQRTRRTQPATAKVNIP
jgi:hypothetical protein